MTNVSMRKVCIVNGDDFGASTGVNRGIIEAHTNGILTSASLMINMPACDDAIELSNHYPGLSVGLHVNLTNEGDPVPRITDIEEARDELGSQYQLFVDRMGKPPSHLDSHHNIHRIPELGPLFRELAERHDLFLREHSPIRYFSNFYGRWDGASHPEQIGPDSLIAMLETEVRPGFTEFACHPGYVADDFISEYALEREIELNSLCHSTVQQRVADLGIELMNYHQVRYLLTAATEPPLP